MGCPMYLLAYQGIRETPHADKNMQVVHSHMCEETTVSCKMREANFFFLLEKIAFGGSDFPFFFAPSLAD